MELCFGFVVCSFWVFSTPPINSFDPIKPSLASRGQLCSELWQLEPWEDSPQPQHSAGITLGLWITTPLLLSIRGEVNSIILIHRVSCVSLLNSCQFILHLPVWEQKRYSVCCRSPLLHIQRIWHSLLGGVQEISRTSPLLPHADLWLGLQPSHWLLFASALLLPHMCIIVLGSFVTLASSLNFCSVIFRVHSY